MVETVILAAMIAGLIAWVLLGREDSQYARSVEANPPKILVRVSAEFWEDSLPHSRPMPWVSEVGA